MGTEIALRNPDDIAALPVEQRGQMITRALEQSKSWLATAVKGTDPTPVEEFKQWAATIAEMVRQKQLSEDIQLDAQEMLRRAERGIALVVREGQRADRISSQKTNQFGQAGTGANNVSARERPSPKSFYANNREYVDAQDMTVGVSDEDFEEALAESRAEGRLTRRDVARKARERSGREKVLRDTRPNAYDDLPDYSCQLAEPACVPVVFRPEMLKKIRAWAAAIKELIPELSLHERDELLKNLALLGEEVHSVPPPTFDEES